MTDLISEFITTEYQSIIFVVLFVILVYQLMLNLRWKIKNKSVMQTAENILIERNSEVRSWITSDLDVESVLKMDLAALRFNLI